MNLYRILAKCVALLAGAAAAAFFTKRYGPSDQEENMFYVVTGDECRNEKAAGLGLFLNVYLAQNFNKRLSFIFIVL